MELRLKDILKERSLTLKAFSEMSGISQPNLSNYINGNISPTLDMLKRIADCLNIEVSDLLRESNDLELYVKYKGKLYSITTNDIVNLINSKQTNG